MYVTFYTCILTPADREVNLKNQLVWILKNVQHRLPQQEPRPGQPSHQFRLPTTSTQNYILNTFRFHSKY